MNVSQFDDAHTARTCEECARQRAENLAILGVKSVLELCVGPSLPILNKAYSAQGIEVWGNDIDPRWAGDKMIIGDAFQVRRNWDKFGFDAFVFAPPLSKGCSGKREDSLMIDQVTPSYYDYVKLIGDSKGIDVLVLPARTFATRQDRTQFHKLESYLHFLSLEAVAIPLTNKVRKYVDVYISKINAV